jgi:ferredoxin--NADP+ reductase
MTPSSDGDSQRFRVAVVGSGPAGFFAAGQLLAQSDLAVEVDVFDRLATPWGLVRAGVAPDHPKIKSVSRVFEKTARSAGFRFWGNVDVGTDLTHSELLEHYHAVLYATGAPTDRRLGIPGENLPGSHAATEFVAWYNGHPDYSDHTFDLSSRRAVIVGNGNVALDVARMLALTPEELAGTDTADHALKALASSQVEEIVVLGRRGPAQAAYTNAELRELGELTDADVLVEPAELELDEHSRDTVGSDDVDARVKANVELLREYAATAPKGRSRRIVLRYLVSPVEILGTDRVEALRVVHNELVGVDGAVAPRPTDRVETIETGLILRSIGYVGRPIAGVPFDESRGTIQNEEGRVTDPVTGAPVPGVYTAGWIKRGPSGVIGTNKKCAQATVDRLLADLADGRAGSPDATPDGLATRLHARGVEVVGYDGWEAIDEHERSQGAAQGRPRVKLVRHEELLARATSSRAPA